MVYETHPVQGMERRSLQFVIDVTKKHEKSTDKDHRRKITTFLRNSYQKDETENDFIDNTTDHRRKDDKEKTTLWLC